MLNTSYRAVIPSQFLEFIEIVRQDSILQARLFNTLSLLEYVGARKIIKSQNICNVSIEILAHASEEIRHSLRLRKLAIRLGGNTFDEYSTANLICGEAAKNYFQNLDKTVSDRLGATLTSVNYYYTTLLIEERADAVYQEIARRWEKTEVAAAVQGILSEEKMHLKEVSSQLRECDPYFDARVSGLRFLEHEFFSILAKKWLQETAQPDGRSFRRAGSSQSDRLSEMNPIS